MNRTLLFACSFVCLWSGLLFGQDDEFKNGLIGQYHSESGEVHRVDPDIAFHWGKSSPHPQVDSNAWKAQWSGQILIRSLTPYTFQTQLNGTLQVLINGTEVLQASSEESQWITGKPIQLSPGFQEMTVHFTPSPSGAEVKLFWSSEEFSTEPISSHYFFHEEDDSPLQLVEQGRKLFDSHRCVNCHRSEKTIDGFQAAPPLWGATSGTNPDWILAKLMGEHPEAKSQQMPHFGFTREQAEDILSFLLRLEAPFDLTTSPDVKPKKGEMTGQELFHSLGCLACHQVGDLGTNGPFSGGPLTHIGNKRSADWLATWLATPMRLNPQHRMPIFKLSRSERGLLASYLSSLGKQPETTYGRAEKASYTERSIRGQELVKEFQCANCHKIPAIEASATPLPPLAHAPLNVEQSCLASLPNPDKKRPVFPHLQKTAITAYLHSLQGKPQEALSLFDQGQRTLERKQCLACHSRGSEQGMKTLSMRIAQATPALQGQTQLVIPPNLNAIGDKLQDTVLDVALSGKQDRVRADWLKVRMPEYQHSPADLAALKHYLIQHDRLPLEASQTHPEMHLAENELLLLGRKLVGAGGWSCIACHQIGDYVPKNTALGTRGSDLMAIGKRLRPEFYYRWSQAPIRIVPGMEMPSFTKPVPGVLEENVHQQLAAIFAAVNDPRFEAPTNPSQVEQLWQVAQAGTPRIVRDVFTVESQNKSEAVARAFAVGFDNQQGLLLDLDQMAVRDWRYGDFARQRTVGKSWYWDLAGISIATGFDSTSELVLLDTQGNLLEFTAIAPDRLAHLLSYSVTGQAVELHYELRIEMNGSAQTVPVKEVLSPWTSDTGTGWSRTITPLELPAGIHLGWRQKTGISPHFNASIQAESNVRDGALIVETPSGRIVGAHPQGPGTSIVVHYYSSAKAPRTEFPERPIVTPSPEKVTTWSGYVGERLPIPAAIMPTSLALDDQGRLLVTSLKGDVLRFSDLDKDGLEEHLELLQEGLSAPFGIVADGNDVLVTHKPELLRLSRPDTQGLFQQREVVADGWGHSDNYHDWVTGPVFDESGNLYVATGSDYSQPDRNRSLIKWRGSVIRATTNGEVEPIASELRYPIGIATDAHGRIFVSDQQGVQNTFNEINHIVPGGAYGVPGQMDGDGSPSPRPATVQIPHPWTRSVNGIFFLPENSPGPFAGHGVGCEFNSKFLIRFTTQEVNGELQGACYPLTRPTWENEANTFLGPICGLASPAGEIYIGSLYDSGWLGGPNVGEIVRLKPTGDHGNGIREVRAVVNGFTIEFIAPVDPVKSIDQANYSLSGYTRIWQGSYATDDSGRYSPEIENLTLSADQKTVTLHVKNLKPTFVYDFNIKPIGIESEELFPSSATYTLNRIPQ